MNPFISSENVPPFAIFSAILTFPFFFCLLCSRSLRYECKLMKVSTGRERVGVMMMMMMEHGSFSFACAQIVVIVGWVIRGERKIWNREKPLFDSHHNSLSHTHTLLHSLRPITDSFYAHARSGRNEIMNHKRDIVMRERSVRQICLIKLTSIACAM
jgi:hypothetical protein